MGVRTFFWLNGFALCMIEKFGMLRWVVYSIDLSYHGDEEVNECHVSFGFMVQNRNQCPAQSPMNMPASVLRFKMKNRVP